MKFLLLVALLTGATAHSISPRAVWQFSNVFDFTIPRRRTDSEYSVYGWYCAFFSWSNIVDELDRCCRTRDNCLAQVDYLDNCASLIRNPYTSSYSFSCSGNEVTCSDKNNPCEAFICNCDREAAICFSQASYNKNYKGDYC